MIYEDASEPSSTPNKGISREDIPSFLLCELSKVEESWDAVKQDENEDSIDIFEHCFSCQCLFFGCGQ